MKTYRVIGKGSVGPFHPNYDPRVDVWLYEGTTLVKHVVCDSGKEGHRYAIERGFLLPEDDSRTSTEWYQDLLAEVRYREANL